MHCFELNNSQLAVFVVFHRKRIFFLMIVISRSKLAAAESALAAATAVSAAPSPVSPEKVRS